MTDKPNDRADQGRRIPGFLLWFFFAFLLLLISAGVLPARPTPGSKVDSVTIQGQQ